MNLGISGVIVGNNANNNFVIGTNIKTIDYRRCDFMTIDAKHISIGNNSDSEVENTIVLGNDSVSKHKNSVVIGNNSVSKHENSVTILNNEFINENLSLNDDNVVIIGGIKENVYVCQGCDFSISSGIRWRQNHEDKDSYINLCFDCIFETVLAFKAKQKFTEDTGDNNSLFNMKKEIEKLRNEMDILYKKLIDK